MTASPNAKPKSWREVIRIHPAAELFPLMSADDLKATGEDIKKNGMRVPIVLWSKTEYGAPVLLLDGRNRLLAAELAGIEVFEVRADKKGIDLRVPHLELYGSDGVDPYEFVLSANIHRRHLTAELKRDLIAKVLKAQPEKSNREIARQVKDDHHKVGAVRRELESTGEVSPVEKTVGKDGKARNVKAIADRAEETARQRQHTAEQMQEAAAAVLMPVPNELVAAELEAPSRATTIVRTHDGREAAYPLPKGKVRFNLTNDAVSWAAWTWNPVTGCLHNCRYCYAREGAEVNPKLRPFYPFGFEPTFYDYRLEAPANTKVPEEAKHDPRLGRVFVTSMGDLFGKWAKDEWIAKVFAAAHGSPEWEYLFLTKFPQRYVGLQLPPTAWIGTTVDEQYRVKIAEEAFRKISGVRVKWLSLEPLLAPLKFTDLSMFDWVVIGAQSATRQRDGYVKEFAPPFDWVVGLVAQAREAGCRVYLKPNLLGIPTRHSPGMMLPQEGPRILDVAAPTAAIAASPPAPAASETVGPLDHRETKRPGLPNFSVRGAT